MLRVLAPLLFLAPLAAQVCDVDLTPPGGLSSDEDFGWSVAIDGDRALVGYPRRFTAFVFERVGGTWVETAELGPMPFERYGHDLALDGDRAVVGASRANHGGLIRAGLVMVFDLQGGVWTLTDTIMQDMPRPHAFFGSAVDVEGDLIVIGAEGDEMQSGSVSFFERSGSTWVQVARRLPSAPTGHFGSHLDMDAGRVLVSARGGGGAFVFEDQGGWTETARLLATSPPTGTCPFCGYGRSVAIDGAVALVGAPHEGGSTTGEGAVYVFEERPTGWTQVGELFDPDPAQNHDFGFSLSMQGDRLAVGVHGDGRTATSIPGAVALYARQGTSFQFLRKLRAASSPPYHGLGLSVDLDGDRVIAGAFLGGQSYFSGGAHIFMPAGPVGTPYCDANPNSTGVPATLTAAGCPHIADNALALTGMSLPPNVFGYFLMANQQAFVPLFGGSAGNLCLGLPIVRFSDDILNSGATGTMELTPDLSALPQMTAFQPGDTWSFQLWFRDVGNTSNTTNGLAVTFETDDEPAVQFPVTVASQVEETVLLSVTVTLSQAAHDDVLVPFTTGGTATYNVDWRVEEPNPIVIPAGATSYDMAIVVAQDPTQEGDETAVITLGTPAGGVLGTAPEFTLTIVDDD